MIDNTFFLFPGQGAQFPGMALDLLESGGDGVKRIFSLASEIFGKDMTALLRNASPEELKRTDVSLIIPHQANARIVHAAAKRLKIPEEKYFLNIEEYANTSAASIPIALDELNRGGKLKKGDLLLTVGFGAGLTYGANLVVW